MLAALTIPARLSPTTLRPEAATFTWLKQRLRQFHPWETGFPGNIETSLWPSCKKKKKSVYSFVYRPSRVILFVDTSFLPCLN